MEVYEHIDLYWLSGAQSVKEGIALHLRARADHRVVIVVVVAIVLSLSLSRSLSHTLSSSQALKLSSSSSLSLSFVNLFCKSLCNSLLFAVIFLHASVVLTTCNINQIVTAG